MTSRQRHRGFTLIELMMVVAIIGLLSSVAIPSLQRATLRARAAERETVLAAIATAVQDIVQAQQCIPGYSGGRLVCGAPGAASSFTSVWDPPGAEGVSKRVFDWRLQGWKDLPMIIQGAAYYSYYFTANDLGTGGAVTLDVMGRGDLDGDGVKSTKTWHYAAQGYSFVFTGEDVTPANSSVIF